MLTLSLLHSVLVSETADDPDDIYIRDVSFSPDGGLLAAGGEDKMIQVSSGTLILVMIIAAIISN